MNLLKLFQHKQNCCLKKFVKTELSKDVVEPLLYETLFIFYPSENKKPGSPRQTSLRQFDSSGSNRVFHFCVQIIVFDFVVLVLGLLIVLLEFVTILLFLFFFYFFWFCYVAVLHFLAFLLDLFTIQHFAFCRCACCFTSFGCFLCIVLDNFLDFLADFSSYFVWFFPLFLIFVAVFLYFFLSCYQQLIYHKFVERCSLALGFHIDFQAPRHQYLQETLPQGQSVFSTISTLVRVLVGVNRPEHSPDYGALYTGS